jgi:hypothetical protein
MNGGKTKIEDPAELAQVRRQARQVHIKAVLSGIALTLLTLLISAGPISSLLPANKE